MTFIGDATAAEATITVEGTETPLSGGGTAFFGGNSTAGDANIHLLRSHSVTNGNGGSLRVRDNASAGNATVTTQDLATIVFENQATAADADITINGSSRSGESLGAAMRFLDNATAGNATITVNGPTGDGFFEGLVFFFENTSVGTATIHASGGGVNITDHASAGSGQLFASAGGDITIGALDSSSDPNPATAANATLTALGGTTVGELGGTIAFNTEGTAADATLIAFGGTDGGSGGQITFDRNATGGNARVVLHAGGTLDISATHHAGLAFGSVEGDGSIVLGTKNLIVGGNHADTHFAGDISGFDTGSPRFALTKAGDGTLTLSGSSDYGRAYRAPVPGSSAEDLGIGTDVTHGTLLVSNTTGSATGAGDVYVRAGATFGGHGAIDGRLLTFGDAAITPGASAGRLTIGGDLILSDQTTLLVELGGLSQGVGYDHLIEGGDEALVLAGILDIGFIDGFENVVTASDTFTIVTSNMDIEGAFANAADGERLWTSDGYGSFRVTYSGAGVVLSDFEAIPEPTSAALLAAAAGLALRRRRG